jgi:protein SCO1/2
MLGRPAGAGELRGWLDAFGVVVIPDGVGGYAHNAAVHVVGPDRRLVAIFDLQDIDGIVRKAREIVGSSVSHVAAR